MDQIIGAYLPLEPPRIVTAEAFGELLAKSGLTARELAVRSGHTDNSVSRWKCGHRVVPRSIVAFLELVIVARRCGITFEPGGRVGGGRRHSAAA